MTELIAGIDEAGRGPLAGPVVAATVILNEYQPINELQDSKKLNQNLRRKLYEEIKAKAKYWGIGISEAEEIDEINIHYATLRAMQRSYLSIHCKADQILVDGLHCPDLPEACTAIIKGDQKVPEISAASILAKVTRDALMLQYHVQWPQYGFDKHKGYPTAQHLAALKKHGPIELHRKSYKPVREAMNFVEVL